MGDIVLLTYPTLCDFYAQEYHTQGSERVLQACMGTQMGVLHLDNSNQNLKERKMTIFQAYFGTWLGPNPLDSQLLHQIVR